MKPENLNQEMWNLKIMNQGIYGPGMWTRKL